MSRDLDLVESLAHETPSRIVLLVMDGLGDVRHPQMGGSPLELAKTPNLDALAARSSLGRLTPVVPGVTPGSGPGHLALFGYDPMEVEIGRGLLEALGLGMKVEKGDVAARGNFCTLDAAGKVSDRRAGRIPTERCRELVERLRREAPRSDGVEVRLEPGMSHRFAAVFHGAGLAEGVTDADPQEEGKPVPAARALHPRARKLARVVNDWMALARKVLSDAAPANGALMRGFSARLELRTLAERFHLKAACIAGYPMYRGLAGLVGMEVLPTQPNLPDALRVLRAAYEGHTFFYVHVKGTDAAGEDGDFWRKVQVLQEVDQALPEFLSLAPDVLAVTGDHSTPALLKGHSWHPVPLLLYAKRLEGGDGSTAFTERACASGLLGTLPMKHLMPLLLAHAGKLAKFGA